MVQPKNRRFASEAYADTAKTDAIADATIKYGGLPAFVYGTRLANDVNLDTMFTPGDYYTESDTYADTARGFPVNRAGQLEIRKFNAAGTHLREVYYPFRHPGFFVRYIYSSAPYTGTPYGSANKGWQEFRNWADAQAYIDAKLPPERSDPLQWAAVGDSLTDGYSNATRWDEADSYPTALQAALPAGVTVTNYGQSGATSDQINMLLGLTPFRVRVTGGSIPASGPVGVTIDQAIGGWTDVQDLTFSGHLEGVYGSLARTSGVWTFTRTASGAVLARTYGTFRAHYASMPTLAGIGGHSMILAYGRNDIAKAVKGMESTIADHVIRAYVDAYESSTARYKQIVMLGTTTRTDEAPDSSGFQMVQEIGTRLRTLYPTHYLDLQGYLTGSDVWTHTGITPTQADLDAQAQGMTPPSLFDDVTHYNRATAQAIGRDFIAPFIKKKGWA